MLYFSNLSSILYDNNKRYYERYFLLVVILLFSFASFFLHRLSNSWSGVTWIGQDWFTEIITNLKKTPTSYTKLKWDQMGSTNFKKKKIIKFVHKVESYDVHNLKKDTIHSNYNLFFFLNWLLETEQLSFIWNFCFLDYN